MVRITFDLIRKRSEHNEGEISTLEEIALHQENIEKIDILNKFCRNLRILLLQNNLIAKIENLNMLKRLEYLNLALNNIEVIENLEGLESLKKLDLTVNFIGDLRGVKRLKCNENLEQLILTGNPCTEFNGYRAYVVASLTQLKELDMVEIQRSERIKALQVYASIEGDIIRDYQNYQKVRQAQITQHQLKEELQITEVPTTEIDEDVETDKFWKQMSHHTPEDRVAIANHCLKSKEKEKKDSCDQPKYVPKLFNPDGKPYNLNQPKVSFKLNDEDDPENIILDVAVYKHLDTAYIDVDIQPNYVRVTIKGKVLQLTLPCEICVSRSTARRNTTTGSLVITMPRLLPLPTIRRHEPNKKRAITNKTHITVHQPVIQRREYLEIGSTKDDVCFTNLVEDSMKANKKRNKDNSCTDAMSTDFINNPDVPELE